MEKLAELAALGGYARSCWWRTLIMASPEGQYIDNNQSGWVVVPVYFSTAVMCLGEISCSFVHKTLFGVF